MSTTIIVNQIVVFEKIKNIATTTCRSKWIVATVITLDPYDKLLNQLNQGLNVTGKSLNNIMSQEANHAIRNGSLLLQFGRMLTMHDTISRDVKQLKNSYQFIRQEFQELRSISNNESLVREKRALLPIVGKALSFLFGTVDEDDFTVIRNNIQTLAKYQIKKNI